MAKIHGYSERGLVNGLFEALAARAGAGALWLELLGRTRAWYHAHPSRSGRAQAPDFKGVIEALHIYIEPSLSGFGRPDVVVLADFEDGFKRAFFLEAKVGTFAQSVGLGGARQKALNKNSSSVLHELFLKARFGALLEEQPERLREGVRIYASPKERLRKIGSDPMVLELVEALKGRILYFVSLTTDPTPPVGAPWPAALRAVAERMEEIDTTNAGADPRVSYQAPLGGWIEAALHMGWDEVWRWGQRHALHRFLDTLRENRSKLSLPAFESLEPPLDASLKRAEARRFYEDFFTRCCGLTVGDEKGGRIRLRDEEVVATYQVVRGLDQQPWLSIYFSGGGSGLFTYDEVQALMARGCVSLEALQARATRVGWCP